MNDNLKLSKIYNVIKGMLAKGTVSNISSRHSDTFVYIISGQTHYTFDNYSFTAKKNDIIFLSKSSKYAMKVLEDYNYIHIDFDFESTSKVRKCEVFSNIPNNMSQIFFRLLHTWVGQEKAYLLKANSMFFDIYASCILSSEKKYTKQRSIISKITFYISENYSDPGLRIEHIADLFGISEVHMRRIFKDCLNTSPLKYITNLRLSKARHLLTETGLSINEISTQSGFNDSFYFSRMFKSHFGITPGEFRKRLKLGL